MSILVKDILKLKSLEEMKLVGGSIGLEKCIEWIYVSECLEDPLEGIKWLARWRNCYYYRSRNKE